MTPKELRALASDKALDIGTAWGALEAAAERIETLEAECASLKQLVVPPIPRPIKKLKKGVDIIRAYDIVWAR